MIKMQDIKLKSLIELFGKEKCKNWAKKYPVLKNNDVERWLVVKAEKYAREGKDIEKFNILSYLRPLSAYCEYSETQNPSELLKENIDTRNKRVVDYLTHLINQGKNDVSVRNSYQSRIKSFYKARGAPITDGLESRNSGKNTGVTALDKAIIKKIYERLTNPNYRVILKIQALMGLRISDVLTEISKTVKEKPKYMIEKHKDHFFIRNFVTQKDKVVIDYLFFPKELTYLIQSIYQVNELTELKLNTFLKTRNGKNIDRYEYTRIIRDIGKELKLGNIRTHSFRKYFRTQLGKSNLIEKDKRMSGNIENLIIESLMGHKVDYSRDVYAQNFKQLDAFYDIWLYFEQEISIDVDIVDNTSELMKDVKKENKQLLEEYISQKAEIKEQYDRIENMESTIKELKSSNEELIRKSVQEQFDLKFKQKLTNLIYKRIDKQIAEQRKE